MASTLADPGPARPARRRHRRPRRLQRLRRHRPRLRDVRVQRRILVVGGDAAQLDGLRHRAGRSAEGAGQAARRHDPAAVQHRGRLRSEVRLLGLQHRRHRAGGRPHPDHGLRLPRQRHRPDRADAVGAVDRPVQRLRHGPGEAADRRAHLRTRVDTARRKQAPARRHLPDRQGLGRVPLADGDGVGDRPRDPRPPGIGRRDRCRRPVVGGGPGELGLLRQEGQLDRRVGSARRRARPSASCGGSARRRCWPARSSSASSASPRPRTGPSAGTIPRSGR